MAALLKAYVLKRIPTDLWHKVKLAALERQITVRDFILRVLTDAVK